MIIVKLIGGLGNQMFQYALGRHLAIKNKTILKLDISDLINLNNSEITVRNYELNNFNIKEEFAKKEDLLSFEKSNTSKITKILEKIKPFNFRSAIHEKELKFDKRMLSLSDNKYLVGYWQSELYFNEIRNILLEEFLLKTVNSNIKNISDKIRSKPSISLHVRRGDYVNTYSKHYHVQNQDYYLQALKTILEVESNCNLFIFSDDIQWCKSNLNFEIETNYVEENQSFEDIYLMSLCNHNIIANSSFSWWGAWLNNNEKKICIAPKKWFKQNKKNNIIPESWITI